MSGSSFDAIVIGSGLGGLTAAALLAKAGRTVCVIERNHSLGGAASAFKHGALMIEPALHQTADPRDPREPKHEILVELGLLDEIEWIPVSPFFSVRGGPVGETFDLPVGFDAAREAMARRFPASRAGIDRLFALIQTIQAGVADLEQARTGRSAGKLLRGALELRSLVGDWRASLDDVLTRTLGGDEAAKFALAGNLAYYADDPRRMWWPFFALAQGAYLSAGGVFIKGGSRVLGMKLAKIVTKAGGSVLLGREAVGVDVDAQGRVAYVRHADPKAPEAPERIGARAVFANCAPDVLAGLLGTPQRGAVERAYGGRAVSTSLFSAHFGIGAPPAKFGLVRYGTMVLPEWMKSLRDTAACAGLLGSAPAGRLPAYGIANYSAIDSGLDDGGPALISVVGLDRLSNWAGLTPRDDKERRERWLDAFQAALDHDYPGLGGAVTERMFLTAGSMHNFLKTPGGAVYGFAPEPPRQGIWAGIPRSPRTPIRGVYLASSFGGSGGFTGAMMSGAAAARMAMADRTA
ncbi:MAG: NAD(P)-binding protein [Beijerinckiaceae bacterium]|nr:NAD(P)-binding protein [Beijerinckiaceae bacterium]